MPFERQAESWPDGGIEALGRCPVCESVDRSLEQQGLRDRTFFCAPGSWDLWSCKACGSAYLDPRPTEKTIHLAYRDYYTHEEQTRLRASELKGLRRLRRMLANGYKNWKFGTNLRPSSRLGVLTAFLMPGPRAILDRQFRHLSARSPGRVLDVGLGDGGFLENARAMGWTAVGTDIDPQVVKNARARGLDARLGTVAEIDGPFDVITLSHVIEHLHDPVGVLRRCCRLLAPGGSIWIETPNIDALGFRRFGADWRGLEPPRHLVLFNRRSLGWALNHAGFAEIRDLPQPSPVSSIYEMSARIRMRQDPNISGSVPLALKLEIAIAKLAERLSKSRREFLAMTAQGAGSHD